MNQQPKLRLGQDPDHWAFRGPDWDQLGKQIAESLGKQIAESLVRIAEELERKIDQQFLTGTGAPVHETEVETSKDHENPANLLLSGK